MGAKKIIELQLPFTEEEKNSIYLPENGILAKPPLSFLSHKDVMAILGNPQLLKDSDKRKRGILNKHLLPPDYPVEGQFEFPIMSPYRGPIPKDFVPYSTKVPKNASELGVHCHIHDYGFQSTWNSPLKALNKVRRYKLAITPDHSLFLDGRICENIEQLRKTRTTGVFWQQFMPVIQSASWGDANSILTYAFDGLAENSWTSISHACIGNRQEQRLYRFAVEKLVERKKPYGLLVFGFPLGFDPGVPVRVFPCHINHLRTLHK